MAKKNRIQQLKLKQQNQNVNVNIHLAEKVKRRRMVRRGGANRSGGLPQRSAFLSQPAIPRRMVQSTIHLPPNMTAPTTPFRSVPVAHPTFVKTTEHLRKEKADAKEELLAGLNAIRKMEFLGKVEATEVSAPTALPNMFGHQLRNADLSAIQAGSSLNSGWSTSSAYSNGNGNGNGNGHTRSASVGSVDMMEALQEELGDMSISRDKPRK